MLSVGCGDIRGGRSSILVCSLSKDQLTILSPFIGLGNFFGTVREFPLLSVLQLWGKFDRIGQDRIERWQILTSPGGLRIDCLRGSCMGAVAGEVRRRQQ